MTNSLTRAILIAVPLAVAGCGAPDPRPARSGAREAAYRANNRGVALMERFAHEPAVEAFGEALALDESNRLARINLPIGLYFAGDTAQSAWAAAGAHERFPDAPQPLYLLGLIARNENRLDDAVRAFERVLALDPEDVATRVHLALALLRLERYDDAIERLRAALAVEPYNATAAYNLGLALGRRGRQDEGRRMLERFEELRTAPYAITYSQAYLEQGRYAEAVASTGAEPDLVQAGGVDVVYEDQTSSLLGLPATGPDSSDPPPAPGPIDGAVTLADLDADGDLDIVSTGAAVRVLLHEGGRFVDRTADLGLAGLRERTTGAVVGDVDNDLRPDLLVLTTGGPRLFYQGSDGRFEDPDGPRGLRAAGVSRAAALADVDHDGDLDVLVGGLAEPAGPAPRSGRFADWSAVAAARPVESRLLRNNGNRTFTDVTRAARLSGVSRVAAAAATDFDNRRDVDLVLLPYGDRPRMFRNLRDGSFGEVGDAVGLPGIGAYTALALADVNKDGFTDLFLGQASAPGLWALSDGAGRLRPRSAGPGTSGALLSHILDVDNDGLLDLIVVTGDGPRAFRNSGETWRDDTDRVLSAGVRRAAQSAGGIVALASGDLDGDGDADLVARLASGALSLWRNNGGHANHSVQVTLAARVSNRSAVAAKVEIRAGSLYQKVETAATTPQLSPADIRFGLGGRSEADTVRVLWPAGILQSEALPAAVAGAPAGLRIEELDRKPSSCPYLYTWNGERFVFVTDFLGGGEMGSWLAPGVRNTPDPVEYVRITDDELRPRDGRFVLRVTNELEETLFLDQVRLLGVTHPTDVAVYPDEGLRATERPFRLHAVRHARPPVAARDEHGHDVLEAVTRLDRRSPDDFETLPIRGYAHAHAVVLDLPPAPAGSQPADRVLLLTGWTDYAFSSDNVAAHQSGLSLSPPVLQVRDGRGWRTVNDDIGFPVGRPQTIVVDLGGITSDQVRIVTNMRIYWDRIQVAERVEGTFRAEEMTLLSATLAWRGFSRPVTPDGREPFGYDYDRVEKTAPWKVMPGRYTREGPVEELVRLSDDRFVIARDGDQLALAFDASTPAPGGRFRRTYLLHAVGYSKEMNLHSASPDRALPVPFGGMSRYPYGWPERYPHERDFERFHTRVVPRAPSTLGAPLDRGRPGAATARGEGR